MAKIADPFGAMVANLQDALLTSEQLVSAILDETTILPDGSSAKTA